MHPRRDRRAPRRPRRRGRGADRHPIPGLFRDDNIVFSTDYPHGDSQYPRAVETFDKLPFPEASKVKICGANWERLYKLPQVKHT